MSHRRHLLLSLASALALPCVGLAQQSGRNYRLGWLGTTAPRGEPYNVAFVERLAELGFVEGRNLTIVYRSAQGGAERLPELATELLRLNCDLYFCGNELSLRALKEGGRATPIVIVASDWDPVANGHVASLSRPGGNITGVSMLQTELPAKRLQVLKELLPKARRVGVLADVASTESLKVTKTAAAQLGIELVVHEFTSTPYDFPAAFANFTRGKAEAIVALGSGFFVPARRLIPELALQHRLPSVFHQSQWADSGGLLSYGPSFPAAYRRAAELAAKVLNGAHPGEIPVEQPNAVEMVINLKTAKALGVTIPQSLRLRADRLIA